MSYTLINGDSAHKYFIYEELFYKSQQQQDQLSCAFEIYKPCVFFLKPGLTNSINIVTRSNRICVNHDKVED